MLQFVRLFLSAVLFSSFALPLSAQSPVHSSESDRQVITLYNQNYAGVYDVRTMNLQSGENRVSISGIPRMYDQSNISVRLDGTMMEAGQLMYFAGIERYYMNLIGEKVSLTGPDGTISGVVDDFKNGILFLKGDDGKYHVIPSVYNYRVATEAQVSLESADPDAVLRLKANRGGDQKVELFYMTTQLGWQPEHRIELNDETNRLNWKTFAAINNNSGKDFENLELRFFSGQINFAHEGRHHEHFARTAMMEMDSGDGMPAQAAEGDYYLYTYPGKTDLRNSERRQVLLHDLKDIRYSREYRHQLSVSGGSRVNARPQITLQIDTEGDHGLATTLPGGIGRFTRSSDYGPVLDGEANIPFLTPGDRLRVNLGRASDITIREIRETRRERGQNHTDSHIEAHIRNNKTGDEVVHITQNLSSNMEIIEASHRYEREGNTITWKIDVPAGEETALKVLVRQQHRN